MTGRRSPHADPLAASAAHDAGDRQDAGGRTNEDWAARSRASVWHPCTQMKRHEHLPLVPIARASGAWLHDCEGRRYLDAIG